MANQVITQYLPTTPPAGAPSPLAVYWLNSSGNRTVDQTGNGKTLTSGGSWVFHTDYDLTGLTGAYFDATGGEYLYRSDEAFRLAKYNSGGDGSYTFEVVVNQFNTGNDTQDQGAIFECGSSGESLSTNILYRMGNGLTSYYQFNERDAGVNIGFTHSGATKVYNEIVYLCMTSDVAGTNKKFYVNGVKVSDITVEAAEKNTSGNTQVFNIGRLFDGSYPFYGRIYSVRVTAGEYSETNVADAYASILGDPIVQVKLPVIHGDSTPQESQAWEDNLSYQYDPNIVYDVVLPSGALDQKPGRFLDSSANYQAVQAWEDNLTYETDTQVDLAKRDEQTANRGGISVWEDELRYVLDRDALVSAGTVDANGHNHFLADQRIMWDGHLYDTTGEPWANPTQNSFTGYARDGYHYTNGVKDSPDDLAPWATEAESNYRGPRSDFPVRAWISTSIGAGSSDPCELVIFDLDQFDGTAASLHMWMRFISGAATSQRFFLQTAYNDYRHSHMRNGVLAFCGLQDSAVGHIDWVDFKIDGSQWAFHHVRTDGSWNLLAGKDITDRNTTSWWNNVSLVTSHSENYYRVQVTQGTADNKYWIVACGEDPQDPFTIYIDNGVPQWGVQLYGENVGEANLNDYWYRSVYLDDNDMLWWSQNTYLYSGADYYKDGALVAEWYGRYSTPSRQQPYVNIGSQIFWITGVRGFLYLATAEGIYKVDKNTLDYWLCYTVANGGGGGRLNQPPAGEILPGGIKRPYKIIGFNIYETGFLTVGTHFYGEDSTDPDAIGGMACVIRTYDDKVVGSWQYGETSNDLPSDGAYIVLPLVRKN